MWYNTFISKVPVQSISKRARLYSRGVCSFVYDNKILGGMV